MLREFLDGRGPGRRLFQKEIVPVIDAVEAFTEREGPGLVPAREAIMQAAAGILLRAAAGPLRRSFWGSEDRTVELARKMFAGER